MNGTLHINGGAITNVVLTTLTDLIDKQSFHVFSGVVIDGPVICRFLAAHTRVAFDGNAIIFDGMVALRDGNYTCSTARFIVKK